MAQPESRLSRKIMTALREQSVFCFKVHGSEHMMAGLPDIVACVDGRFVCFETKMPAKRNNTSPRQEYVHALIRRAGGRVEVVTSVTEALEVVQEIRADVKSCGS